VAPFLCNSDHEEEEERVIRKNIGEIGWDGMDWIELAQDTDQWRALVNTVKNLGVP
jgi:hypothetical protein